MKPLSEVAGQQIDEVFIGSCMTNIGHFRAAGKLLQASGQSIPPGCGLHRPKWTNTSLRKRVITPCTPQPVREPKCQAVRSAWVTKPTVAANTTVVSTSTRNFPNRLGQGADVYLSSAELAAIASVMGKLPTVEEYMNFAKDIDTMASDIYRYLNFDQMPDFSAAAEEGKTMVEVDFA